MDKAQAMRLEACLPDSWWEFAVEHAVHCYNRTPVRRLNWCTPFEALNRTAPSISHLRVFGCGAYVYLPQDMRKDKLASKSELMVYLGVAEGIKGHRFMCTTNNQLFTATTALFDEKLFPKCKTSAPKPITQVREPVSTDTLKPRTISWDDDNDDDESPVAWRPPHRFIPPPAYGAVPPAPLAPPAAPPPPAPYRSTPYTPRKKHMMPLPQGDPPRPPSTPPSQTGGPSRMRTQSYSPREEEDDDVLPSQPQEELPPPLPQRSPLRTPSRVTTSPEDTPVPLR
jgi:hypothetical protein